MNVTPYDIVEFEYHSLSAIAGLIILWTLCVLIILLT